MTDDFEVRHDGRPVTPGDGWAVDWLDRDAGIARVGRDGRSTTVVVEGEGSSWWVTLRGRRIGVEVRSWRERVLAEAESRAEATGGPMTVTATLPGLVVAVRVAPGDEVEAGTALLTIEAMKMQNDVRAPRPGRVGEISVVPGQAVATGTSLLRLE
jgi:acetyl/propionyl-CoA carboxylase alpha subunit